MENTAQPLQPASPGINIQPQQMASQPPSPTQPRSYKKLASIAVILLLLVAIPPTLYILGQRQNTQQRAASEVDPNAIATVNGKSITQADIDASAKEYTGSTPKQIEDMLIERRVLEDESKKTGIVVNDADVKTALASTNMADFTSAQTEMKYTLLKEKIVKAQVKYIEGYVIDFWLPPFDYPVKLAGDKQALVTARRASQKTILEDIRSQLQSGVDPVEVARQTYLAYPAFQGSLGMNGKIITTTISDAELQEPYIYILSNDRKKTAVSDTMEAMKEGDVRVLKPEDGSGGKVVKVTHINDTLFSSYDEWLGDMKLKYVKIIKQL